MSVQDGDINGYRDTVKRELEDLIEDMFWSEKIHFARAEDRARINLWLGLGSTIAASVAAATVVADVAPTATGIAALVAAIASGLLTFLKPKDAEQRHLDAARRLGALRVKAREAIRLDLSSVFEPDPQAWRDLVKEIAVEKAKIDQDAPATSERALRRARRKIDAGHFEHESDQR